MTLRFRSAAAALLLASAGLSACATETTSPLEPVSVTTVDTTRRAPTIPWTSANSAAPTIPWTSVNSTAPTIPWN